MGNGASRQARAPTWVFNDLFSKFGMQDGDAPYANEIHALFSAHLARRGFDNTRISSHHNERVVEIRVGERRLDTWRLAWGPPWVLVDGESAEEVAAPPALERALLDFAPRAAGLIQASLVGIAPPEAEPVELDRRFPLDGRPRAVQVPIVTGGGRRWHIVSRAKAFGTGSSAWVGRPSRKKRGMKLRAERALRAALQNPCGGAPPCVTFVFLGGVSREVGEALLRMGAEVRVRGGGPR
ncbi:MAG: hypothetical protein ABW277_23280 [Longimicrobiaceae bacterium]